ncbi:MAG: insulinase family protein [Clostridia bacterium]|nr:insulinase family protein [Clostridia bacterium]
MPAWNIGDRLHGFRIERTAPVPALNADYWKLTHEKTGATLYYSDRDDGQMAFGVGFRTLPENDTGVFHILEHSTLDGSEHFPLKEPFVNLMKTSMAVDLNAGTYEDKTIYHFISTDEQDYMNMMTVYLDAVFHPMLLSDRRIFEKEAWHLEPDGKGGLGCSGVVFNEMQGNDNNPMRALYFKIEEQIYPDLFHRFNSGGDPACIHTLTYEKFVEYYHRFYGADNAVFYLSGKLGLDRELACIDEVLCGLDTPQYAKPDPAPLQKPVVSPDGTAYYQLADNEEIKGNTHLGYACIMDHGAHTEDALGMELLSQYLTETTESPLSKAVLAAGVGMDFAMEVDTDDRQPMVLFTMGKSDPEHAEGFRRAILDRLTVLCAEGLDYTLLRNIMGSYETNQRRASLSVRVGYRIMESIIGSHVQLGDAQLNDNLAILRTRVAAEPRYFETLIEKYILNSNHWCLTKCIPSRTLVEEKRAKMSEWLKAESDRLHAEEGAYEALEAKMAAFNQYLIAPDSPEAEASIPHLTPADITSRPVYDDMPVGSAVINGREVTSLTYLTDTNGMVNASLLFDLTGLDKDELFYVRCLSDSLLQLPTEAHDVPALNALLEAAHVNMSLGIENTVRIDNRDTLLYLRLLIDVPEEQLAGVVKLADEYMTSVVFDRAILRQLFSNPGYIKNMMIRRGNRTAARLAETGLTASAVYEDAMTGITAYHKLQKLAEHFDEEADGLITGLQAAAGKLFTAVKPVALYIGSASGYDAWAGAIAGLSLGADAPDVPVRLPGVIADRSPKAFTIPGEVNYCAEVFDLSDVDVRPDPRMRAVTTLINTRYFWDEIRAKGGAYGASCGVSPYGVLTMTSYRDPRVDDTFGVYARLADWLEQNVPGDDELGSLIVSTASGSFTPQSPIDRGNHAFSRWLLGLTAEKCLADLEALLSASRDDFIAFAALVRRLAEAGGVKAVIGGEKPVAASALFDRTEEL